MFSVVRPILREEESAFLVVLFKYRKHGEKPYTTLRNWKEASFPGKLNDESAFGGKRKEKRGRGAQGKNIVFGLLERNESVYTRVVEHGSKEDLMESIRKKQEKNRYTIRTLLKVTIF